MRIKNLRNSVGALAMTLALSACMPSDNASNEMDRSREFTQAQSKLYAQSLQQYASRSQHLLTNTSSWQAGTISNGEVIDVAALGADLGSAEEYVQSGYCVIDPVNPTNAMHITWFQSEDDAGNFIIKGIGSGNSGHIVRALSSTVSGNNLGIRDGGSIKLVSTGAAQALPAGCAGFDIPEGSPVLMFNIKIPQGLDEDVVQTEYRTASCTPGMIGHVVQSLNVLHHPDGTKTAGAVTISAEGSFDTPAYDYLWATHSDNCSAPVVLASLETRMTNAEGVDMSAIIANGPMGTAGNVVNNRLSEVACSEAEQVESERADPEEEGNPEENSFSTCASSVDVAALQSIGEVFIRVESVEDVTKPCGGTEGEFRDEVAGWRGQAQHEAWDGEAKYRREILRHSMDDDLVSGGDNDRRNFRERWEGVSLSCDRGEALNITCGSVYEQFNGEPYSRTDNRGFNYTRNNTIRGWADNIALTPNDPANPQWQYREGQSGCAWRETERWTCSEGNEVAGGERADNIDDLENDILLGITVNRQEGHRFRDFAVTELAQRPDIPDWTLASPATCTETRVRHLGCTDITEQRTYTSPEPGSGNWGGWTQISSVDVCGGSGGGGGNCLAAGTLIAMADGTSKPVELIEAGDMTIAGRVLQTMKRSFDSALAQTSEGLFMTGGGLFAYDGVVGTGRHPIHTGNGRWVELGEYDKASPVNGDDVRVVYNLLMEHHVIPVIGESGTIYAYADDLNNAHNSAEKGRIRVSIESTHGAKAA